MQIQLKERKKINQGKSEQAIQAICVTAISQTRFFLKYSASGHITEKLYVEYAVRRVRLGITNEWVMAVRST